jgi:predicted nuclease of predicted toxin-antitoxin system
VADEIRFFADQHFPYPVVAGIRRRGIDIVTAQEAGRCQRSDAEQLSFAQAMGRVLATFDSDFVALHQTGIAHAGIAWCQASKYSIGELIQVLVLLHAVLRSSDMKNHLEYL